MNLSTAVLGITAVEQLRKTAKTAVLEIGSDKLTRADLARVGCFNFVAARLLSNALHDELKVKNLRQVYEEVPPSALALPHVGVISLAVLGAAFEAKGIGGDEPLENYVRKHATVTTKDGEPKYTTFSTMKKHEQDDSARERKDRKARKSLRRDRAHKLRVERFEQRAKPA